MDTVVSIKAYGENSPHALEQALAFIKKVDALVSRYEPGSDIYRINTMAGKKPVPVDKLTFNLIKEAVAYGDITGGALDVTIGPLVDLWRIPDAADRHLPSRGEIESRLQLVDYRQVILDSNKTTVFLPREGASLDLGSVAKGFAARGAVTILRREGVQSALVTLGGHVYALGNKPGRKTWQVGIQDPFKQDHIMATLNVTDLAIDTAGGYYRYKEINGEKLVHIIDPATGMPAGALASVTVITGDSFKADALATAVYVLGEEKGLALLQKERAAGIIVTRDGRILTTSNLKEKVPDFKLIGVETGGQK
ncbi:Thiamine biosynthesis lipoprotein ApbE [Moorella glycerini]|uniref:FAD:protein FMN transferase n=2 Tax=Neomoorella stamsii TaxID=1266720 RepID=A0A9X7J513_9FIRM|nr:Thiamine biosynthesis lipoprotein ApbE precursor [Moorella stamsii]CEP66753.1 Thiamine biosynthesis lipoprotein ApbE [Moorella glycerini]